MAAIPLRGAGLPKMRNSDPMPSTHIANKPYCKASLYTLQSAMIKSFRHKGIEAFFLTGSKAGIQAHHAAKLRVMLTALNSARSPGDLNAPGWRLHKLGGDLKGFFSVTVNGNWRLIFRFDGSDAELVDYLDYH